MLIVEWHAVRSLLQCQCRLNLAKVSLAKIISFDWSFDKIKIKHHNDNFLLIIYYYTKIQFKLFFGSCLTLIELINKN